MNVLVHHPQKELGAREPPVNFVTRQGILAFGSNARNLRADLPRLAALADEAKQNKCRVIAQAEGPGQAFTAARFSRATETSPERPRPTIAPPQRASWPGPSHLGPAERQRPALWCALLSPRQASEGRRGADRAPARPR